MLRRKHLRICSYNKVVIAEMALHPKLVQRRRVVHADFLLLRVVADAHADVVVASETPNVERHFEPARADVLVATVDQTHRMVRMPR